MKFLSVLGFLLLCSCSTPRAIVGPKPDVAPVRAGNEQTRKHISDTRSYIKSSQLSAKGGEGHLERAKQYMDELLK